MPLLLGMSAFAPLTAAPMRPVALGSLVGHLVYGLLLGGIFAPLAAPKPAAPEPAGTRPRPTELLRR